MNISQISTIWSLRHNEWILRSTKMKRARKKRTLSQTPWLWTVDSTWNFNYPAKWAKFKIVKLPNKVFHVSILQVISEIDIFKCMLNRNYISSITSLWNSRRVPGSSFSRFIFTTSNINYLNKASLEHKKDTESPLEWDRFPIWIQKMENYPFGKREILSNHENQREYHQKFI